jgi:predicted PurR-regulated permease PerM
MRRTDGVRSSPQLLTVVLAIVAVATLYFARVVFVPFTLAVLFAFLLTPIVSLFDRIRMPRAMSSLLVVAVAIVGLAVLGWYVTGQLLDVADQLPAYRSTIRRKIESVHNSKNQSLNKAADAVNEIGKELVSPVVGTPAPVATTATNGKGTVTGAITPGKPMRVEVVPPAANPFESLNSLIGPISVFGIVTVFTLFMLIRREDLRNRFIRLVGHKHLNVMTQALDDASSRVSRYLILQLGVNIGFGLVVGTGLYFIGVPHVLLWGAVAALLRFLPYVGAVMSAVLPILLSLAMFDGWTKPLLTLGLYVGVELIVGNLVEPMVYGAQVGLSSLAILVSAVFWTILWGPVGLVLSTPLTVCLVVLGRYVPNLGFLSILLGDDPVLAPESHYYQRLLASDQNEAKAVLENYLKDHTLQQLYTLVLIPALAMAEQDRHANDLDDATEQFIISSTKEFIEELTERAGELTTQNAVDGVDPVGAAGTVHAVTIAAELAKRIVCVPARDDADEMVGMMLAHLLEQCGHHSQAMAIGTVAEMLAAVEKAKPEIICISALPPFAISHARNIYERLRELEPDVKMVIGLWGFSGDVDKIAARLKLQEGDRVVFSLDQALMEMNGSLVEAEDERQEVT